LNWESFYLVAFLVGFLLSLVSFLAGTLHVGHAHLHGHSSLRGAMKGTAGKGAGGRGGLSPFNLGTAAAFLAWFGGTGYLLEHYSGVWAYLGLLLSAVSGLVGAAVVFWFLSRLLAHDQPLDPADYDMVGVLAHVTSPIRSGGTGEVQYSRDGARKAAPARSEDGSVISRDTEVIVTRYEKGIAYVRPWDEFSV
jgi:membrane protein implicated in regulation of membrane protease activity